MSCRCSGPTSRSHTSSTEVLKCLTGGVCMMSKVFATGERCERCLSIEQEAPTHPGRTRDGSAQSAF
eukprot:167642-Prymnesium_polylepis.1